MRYLQRGLRGLNLSFLFSLWMFFQLLKTIWKIFCNFSAGGICKEELAGDTKKPHPPTHWSFLTNATSRPFKNIFLKIFCNLDYSELRVGVKYSLVEEFARQNQQVKEDLCTLPPIHWLSSVYTFLLFLANTSVQKCIWQSPRKCFSLILNQEDYRV